jgi:prevent-host-death family protein
MTRVGVARLKAHLSRYLEAAKRGEEIVVTDRGQPVAKLVALTGPVQADSRRRRLARAGLLVLGRGRLRPGLRRPPAGPRVGDAVLRALLDERRQGR